MSHEPGTHRTKDRVGVRRRCAGTLYWSGSVVDQRSGRGLRADAQRRHRLHLPGHAGRAGFKARYQYWPAERTRPLAGCARARSGQVSDPGRCGTGYYTALLAHLVGPMGKVYAYEIEDWFAARAHSNLDHLPHAEVRMRRIKPRGQAGGNCLDHVLAIDQPRVVRMRMQPIESEPLRGRQRARYRGELLVVSW
jgi:hypothetical protein